MKKLKFILISMAVLFCVQVGYAQNAEKKEKFTGAKATLDSYKALYIINSSDEKRVKGALKNINNALKDPRLIGKLEVELVVFSDGVEIYKKESPYAETLKDLHAKGVVLAQCENTLNERKIEKSELYPFISFVPSGNGEIIIRHYEGWAIVHP